MRLFILLLSLFYSYLPVNKTPHKLIYKTPVTDPVQDDKFAVPSENIGRLFYMQRTSNSNTLIYELNAKNGQLDDENPMHVYWLRYAEKGQKEELNYIQRKFAYGLVTKKINNDQYDVRFVSYKKFPLLLMKANDGKYHIFATIEQKQMMLNRIFVKIEGGSFWLPNIIYVELKGTDPSTGREITHRFKP
ncbi:DUF4833 domain-containing protein [Mucilaginibacter sp.]|uniref:DUF4833 domain-containing protein n=1 Tax=Mucilaginibacter sp. TaxID=1882438 RepID=UPI002629F8B3|nr:DUF4833 domain-containing protein [Mucilaginibacter sp.]MDB4927137.1 CDP-alcohol phosphatidyltransferase [Mucilaginibacter sp.]